MVGLAVPLSDDHIVRNPITINYEINGKHYGRGNTMGEERGGLTAFMFIQR